MNHADHAVELVGADALFAGVHQIESQARSEISDFG
jgi:hypothetical protein